MAGARRAVGTVATANNVSSIAPGVPAGNLANDIQVMVACVGGSFTTTMPAGWTQKISQANGTEHKLEVWWKRSVGGDTAPTVTFSGNTDATGRIVSYSGCTTSGDPFNAFGSQANASSVTATSPAITPLAANSMILFVSGWTTTGAGTPTCSAYSGANPAFTEAIDNVVSGTTRNAAVAVADGLSTSTSSLGTRTGTWSAADLNSAGMLALSEATSTVSWLPLNLAIPGKHPGPRQFQPISRAFSAATNTDITLALTGVAGTGAVGNVGVTHDQSLTGNAATGVVGSLVGSQALTGVAGTGQVGTVGVAHDNVLTGIVGTGAVGTVTPNVTIALTGVVATGQVGTLTPSAVIALTGVVATGQVGTLAPSTTLGLTGVAGTGAVGTVSVAAGSDLTLAITGVAGTGVVGTLTPSSTVALTGVAGTGAVGTVAVAHSQALTGNAATAAVGTLTPSSTVALTGAATTGQVGTVSVFSADITIALTGVSATGQVGTLAATGGDVVIPVSAGAVGGGSSSIDRKSAKQRRREERELEDDIRRIYRKLSGSGVAEVAAKAEAIAQVITSPAEAIKTPAAIARRAQLLTMKTVTVEKEIALRLLEQELKQKRRAENMKRIQMILQLAG